GAGGFGRSPVALDLRQFPPQSAGEGPLRDILRHNLAVLMNADPAQITDEAGDLHPPHRPRPPLDRPHLSPAHNMPPTLQRIACPVQMIWGERDVLPYPNVQARADTARAARPDLRVDIVPGAGHWVQFEAPEAVNRALLDFFTTTADERRQTR